MNLLEVFGLLFFSILICSPTIYIFVTNLLDYKKSQSFEFKLLEEIKDIAYSMGYEKIEKEDLDYFIKNIKLQIKNLNQDLEDKQNLIKNLNKEIKEKKQEIKILNNGILFLKEFEQPIYNNLSADEVGKILYEFIEFVNEAKGYKIGVGTGLIYRFLNEKLKIKEDDKCHN